MRHREHTFKIGRSGAHRKALLANQVSSLIEKGEIKTTLVKAKESRRLAEKMVTMGKKGDLHHRRLAISKLRDKAAVAKLFAEIAPKYANRDGGYTRIVRLGRRLGDAAEICLLQWVVETAKPKSEKKKKDKGSAKSEETVANAAEPASASSVEDKEVDDTSDKKNNADDKETEAEENKERKDAAAETPDDAEIKK
ncbi:MAG: 50S ribosomal protein L17 [Kiritimatiellaeota bacterium]|nr:50S ribosomal protein L17 [Kiritimatiellota bacterium]